MRKQIFLILSITFILFALKGNAQFFIDNSCTVPWDDIHTTGTALGLSDDGEAGITIPFTFNLDGVSSSNMTIGNNGAVLFNTTTGSLSFSNTALTISTAQGFYAFWDDIYDTYGNVYWEVLGTAPNRRLVVEWYQRPHITPGDSCTFEILLFEGSNQITFLYQDVYFGDVGYDYGASATVGVVGQNGAYQFLYDTPSLNGITCINYFPIQHDIEALSLNSPISDCSLGASETIDVTIQNNAGDSAYDFNVSYSIDGGSTWQSELCTDTVFPYSTLTYTFATTEDFSTIGNYNVLFAVDYTGDEVDMNDTLSTIITNSPVISSFPYFENFEANNGYWSAQGTNPSWQWGVPSGTVINSAGSGSKAWVTNLSGLYNNDETSYILSPCFDFSSLISPNVQLKINYNIELTNDGALLQSTIDGGMSWSTVGVYGDPFNWYNTASTPPKWSDNSNGWLIARHEIASLAGQSSVRFRIVLLSNSSINNEGIGIDDFEIFDQPSNDLTPISLINPSTGCGLTTNTIIETEIYNVGTATQGNFDISFSIDNGATWTTENYSDTLASGDTLTYTFTGTADLSVPGNYNVLIAVNNIGDVITSNDTISTIITSLPTIDSYPYFENFESGNGGWISGGTSSTWELGAPAGTYINTAYSGTNSWMTGLSTDYNNYEESYVESPCLDFSSLVQPILELSEIFYTESIDGGYIEYSTDGGFSWSVLGVYGDPDNWYNNSGNRWGGTSGATWAVAKHDLTGLGGISSVKLRVHFHSDGSVVYDGFAFDDVRIYDKPANDLMPLAWVSPMNGCGMTANDTVKVQIFNNGTAPQDTFDISYSIDSGATWVTETYYDTLQVGDTLLYSFLQTADFSIIGDYHLFIAVNNTGDELSSNDTIAAQITSLPTIDSYPYFENFESGNGGWTSGGTSSTWELGAPAGTYINTAYSGTNSWMTGLSTDYNNYEESYVESPCLDFSSLVQPILELSEIFYTESIDGGYIEYSTDGGFSWSVLGVYGDPDNWYNNSGNRWGGTSGATWAVAKHDLTGLGGISSVKLRVHFHSDGSVVYDGFAFDDVRIYDKPANDLLPLAWISPMSGCGLSSGDTVKVQIFNNGIAPQDTFDISYSIDSGATWVTETYLDTIGVADTLLYAFNQLADFSIPGDYNIFVVVNNSGDALNNNDTIQLTITNTSISSFPYQENFESFVVGSPGTVGAGWTINPTSGYTWYVDNAGTPSTSTGPTIDHTLGDATGIYMYTEASSGSTGYEADLILHCIDMSSLTLPRLSFWYHMYGSTIDRLVVDQAIGGVWYPVDSLMGQQQANQTDDWLEIRMNLSNLADSIRFRAIRGTSYYGDISIDDILIEQAPANDIATISWDNPIGGCGLTGAEVITFTYQNMGAELQDSVTVSYSIDSGATWVTEMVPDTILPDSMFTYSFTTTADFSALGHYYCFVAVTNFGDINSSNDTLYVDFESVPLISTFPYTEDFESGNGGWISGGTLSTWELGTPAGTVINSAASGSNSWMTNLSGYYNNLENSWVIGPCFDFSSLTYPMIDLSAWVNAENSWDGAVLQYSLDEGTTWSNVGSSTDPQWYNDNSISGLAFTGSQDGFTGTSINTWHTITHALDGLGGLSDVKLRIAFGSDGSVNSYDGFAFDDIHIYEGTFPDLAVIYPYDNDTMGVCQGIDSLRIGLFNNGSAQVDSGETVYIYYQINGGLTTNDYYTFSSPFNVSDTVWITFTYPYNFSIAGTYSYLFYISYSNDNNATNDTVSGYFIAYNLTLDLGADIHTTQPDTVVIDAGPMFESYLWQDASTNQTFNVTTYGTFYVNVVDSNGCEASDTIVVDNQVGIPLAEIGNISIYPNPNNGNFVLSVDNLNEPMKIEILSITGQVLLQKQSVDDLTEFDLSKFDKGIYFIRVTQKAVTSIKKIIIE